MTGESEAENKRPATLARDDVPLGDRENMVFMGTSITAGTGRGVVAATAMNTELGRIAGLIEEAGAEEKTPLETKLESFGRVLVEAMASGTPVIATTVGGIPEMVRNGQEGLLFSPGTTGAVSA